jgi:hypothetical protein
MKKDEKYQRSTVHIPCYKLAAFVSPRMWQLVYNGDAMKSSGNRSEKLSK